MPASTENKILIVDDDPVIRLMLQDFFEKKNYCIAQAEHGLESITAFQAFKPNCILMDIKMPIMSGLEACSKIRSLPDGATVPIVMMTVMNDDKTVDSCYRAGASDYICKPIHWAMLRNRVCTIFERILVESKLKKSELQYRTG